jgi:hypothetical protein
VLANYRTLLGAKSTVPAELAQIPGAKDSAKPAAKPKSAKAAKDKND